MASFALTNSGTKLFTLEPNGDNFRELIGATEQKKNRIGEYKKFEITLNTDTQSLKGLTVYVNPALFINSSAPVPNYGFVPTTNYWSFQVDPLATAGTYDMFLTCSIGYNSDLIKNNKCEIIINDEFNFKIVFYYYQIYDLNSFLNPSLESNADKLLKDRATNPNQLSVSGTSVYTDTKQIPRFYIYINDVGDNSIFSFITVHNSYYAAGFYAKDENQADPYFSDPSWRLESPVGTVVPTLQLAENTRVFFKFTAPVDATDCIVWMIKTNAPNSGVDMKTSYDASHYKLITTNTSLQKDNKIWSPMSLPYTSGLQKECFFTVDKNSLQYGDKYRFIAIPYYDDPDYSIYEVNSFISDEYTVDVLPKFTGEGYEFDAGIVDYLKEYKGNNLKCVVEERLKSKAIIDYSDDAFLDDIATRLGLTVTNDIRRYLTKITVETFEDNGSGTIQYFDRVIAYKLDPLNYSAAQGLTLDFTGDVLTVSYDFRVRYESWITNLQTVVGGIALATPNSNMNMAGRTVKILYSLELYYDDYSTPFSDVIKFQQQIRPEGYGAPLALLDNDESAIGSNEYYLNDSDPCFKAKLTAVAESNLYKLITTAEKEPGLISLIEENEEFAGALSQADSDKFINQESDFGQTEADKAKFCLDASKFFVNSPYKVSVIAKKDAVIPKEFEDGITDEFEDDQNYQFEN